MKNALILSCLFTLFAAIPAQSYVSLVASPSSVNFSPTVVGGGGQSRTLQLINYGNEVARSVQVFASCGQQFRIHNDCYSDLRPNQSCTVIAEFSPQIAGTFTCQVNAYSFGGGSTQFSLWATVESQH